MSKYLSADQLTTPATKIRRSKYFPVELFCANMLPNTTYDIYFEGILVNAFCKPFGGNLGDPLTSTDNGKLTILFLMSVEFDQQYLATQTPDNNIVNQSKMIELRSPTGHSSVTYLPMVLKAG